MKASGGATSAVAKKRTYTEAEKDQAVALYATDGPTAVQHELGVPKGTVTKWAKARGVATVRTERMREAHEAVMADAAERRARLATRLLTLAEVATEVEFDLVDEAGLRDVVGARTRAIHDHQLLMGGATARTETTPAPDRTPEQEQELARVLRLVPREGHAA